LGIGPSPVQKFSDWIGLDLDGPGPDWSIAGLVESLVYTLVGSTWHVTVWVTTTHKRWSINGVYTTSYQL